MYGCGGCAGRPICAGEFCNKPHGTRRASDCLAGTGGGVLGRICGNQTRHGCLDWKNPENGACRECSVFDMGCFLVYKIIGGEIPDSVGVRKTFLKICEKCVALCSAKLSYSIERQRWILLEKTGGD